MEQLDVLRRSHEAELRRKEKKQSDACDAFCFAREARNQLACEPAVCKAQWIVEVASGVGTATWDSVCAERGKAVERHDETRLV